MLTKDIIPNSLPRIDGFIYNPQHSTVCNSIDPNDLFAWVKPVSRESIIFLTKFRKQARGYDPTSCVYYFDLNGKWDDVCRKMYDQGLRFVIIETDKNSSEKDSGLYRFK